MKEISQDPLASYRLTLGSAGGDLVHFSREASGRVSPHEVAKQFEQIFAQQLLREMSSTLEEGFFGSAEGSHVYQGFFETFVAQKMADSGGLGIAPLIERAVEDQTRAQRPERLFTEEGSEQKGKP